MRYETDMRGGRNRIREDDAELWLVVTGMSTTILLHGVLVFLVVVGTMCGDRAMKDDLEPKKLEFEDVELLSLGEEKPDEQLPRISNPPAPTPDEETVALEETEEKKEEKEKPEEKTQQKTEDPPDEKPAEDPPDDRNERMNEAFENLHDPNRPTNTDVPEGSEEGVAAGTVSDEAMASLMKTYRAKLLGAIGERWQIPQTIPEEELDKLFGQARVYVRLSRSGHVVTYRFLDKTSNEQFNASIERLLRKFQAGGGGHTLPVPSNPKVQKTVIEDGLQLQNWKGVRR